jgi:hypothetical protein
LGFALVNSRNCVPSHSVKSIQEFIWDLWSREKSFLISNLELICQLQLILLNFALIC